MAPVILLIPGAWHVKAAIEPLAEQLQALGQRVQITQLESVGSLATIGEDAVAIGKLIGTLADEGEDILLVPHSYAGAASAPVLKEFAKVYRREQGKPGGIIGLAYIAAILPPEGPTWEEMVGGKLPPWQLLDEEKKIVTVDDAANIFYNDLPAETAEHYVSLLKYQSLPSFRTPGGHPGYTDPAYDGKRAYIHAKKDNALPTFVQGMMLEQSGVEWQVKTMDTSHSPFLSKPHEVAQFLVDKAREYST